jgi:hypothetical protein
MAREARELGERGRADIIRYCQMKARLASGIKYYGARQQTEGAAA